ncbi:hypothetical protein [Chitinophaga vietnamensis]|uniref:hypothetical protein n=1 Tax=Chitinophaga vietnamensis TaxID=2593957 RepID=UPI0011773DCA|nr:hypothetical protein [Chitinophaga vietnamensis]
MKKGLLHTLIEMTGYCSDWELRELCWEWAEYICAGGNKTWGVKERCEFLIFLSLVLRIIELSFKIKECLIQKSRTVPTSIHSGDLADFITEFRSCNEYYNYESWEVLFDKYSHILFTDDYTHPTGITVVRMAASYLKRFILSFQEIQIENHD